VATVPAGSSNTPKKSQSEHILELSRELLDDIELGRLEAEKLLLKCSRLARLVGSDEIQAWIELEMRGYNFVDRVSIKYMGLTGRWTDYQKKEGYWGPLAQQEASIRALNAELVALRLPDVERLLRLSNSSSDNACGVTVRCFTVSNEITIWFKPSGQRLIVIANEA
jgi:hypothetical protein